ncbi:hypothetical protein H4582DRAFT_650960 [Lactarius indigo]|nr:hypothetical protein H4582DRAFT_650960 [Lactarius indigo]
MPVYQANAYHLFDNPLCKRKAASDPDRRATIWSAPSSSLYLYSARISKPASQFFSSLLLERTRRIAEQELHDLIIGPIMAPCDFSTSSRIRKTERRSDYGIQRLFSYYSSDPGELFRGTPLARVRGPCPPSEPHSPEGMIVTGQVTPDYYKPPRTGLGENASTPAHTQPRRPLVLNFLYKECAVLRRPSADDDSRTHPHVPSIPERSSPVRPSYRHQLTLDSTNTLSVILSLQATA